MSSSPALAIVQEEIRAKAKELLPGCRWFRIPGLVPPPGQLSFELMQVARYKKGQHYRAHHDGFSRERVALSRVQRRATLLVYLNDVSEGGETRFEYLNVTVRPKAG